MAKLKSIFGSYAEQTQLVIDARNDRFDPLWFPQYFSIAPAQMGLTFTSVIGEKRIEAVASVVDRDSETPTRNRPDLRKYSQEIPSLKEMFKMKESDLREFHIMKNMPVSEVTKRNQMLDFIWNDTRKVGNAVYKRVDMFCLEAISTGKVTIDVSNNPDGIVLPQQIDFLMPSGNKSQATISWASSSSKPLADITAKVKAARNKGVVFGKMLMSDALFENFKNSTEVINTLTAYFYGPKPGTGFNPVAVSTLDNVNSFLTANRLPVIEIIDKPFGVENDGKISIVRPFSDNNVSFLPMGMLGEIKQAIAMEELQKATNVDYAKFNEALISKWSQNEPLREWTKAEWNAFPALDAIDSIFILEAVYV